MRKTLLRAMEQSKFGKFLRPDKELDKLADQRIRGTITREQYNRRANALIKRRGL